MKNFNELSEREVLAWHFSGRRMTIASMQIFSEGLRQEFPARYNGIPTA